MRRRSSDLGSAFSALITATVVTNLGDGLRMAALPLLASTMTTSPVMISGITAAQFLPWTTFAPFGGAIVDRSDRRRLIMTTQTWRALVMAILGVAVLINAVQVWHLFVVAFMITIGEILVDPSVIATVPTLVRSDDLDRANSRITVVETITNDFAGGPIGAVTFGIAPWLPFALDALSYLGSIIPFSRIPASRPRPQAKPSQRVPFTEISAGASWIVGHPFLKPLTIGIAVFHLGSAGAFSLLILLVTDVLDASDITFGIVLLAAAIGATITSLSAARLTDRFSRRTVITAGALVSTVSVIAAGLVTNEAQLIAVWGINGAAGGILLAIGRGFVQRHTPNDRLGRTAIAQRVITRTSFVVGALLAGMVADLSSVRWSFVLAGSLHFVGAGLMWRSFEWEADPTEADLASQV